MRYQYTQTSGDPSSTLREMAEKGWRINTYHVTTQGAAYSGQFVNVTHHILWEVDDNAPNEYRGAV